MALMAARRLRLHWLVWPTIATALTVICILFVDRPVATWSHNALHRPTLAVAITKLADMRGLDIAVLIVPTGALILRLTGRPLPKAWRTAIAACLAVLLATVTVVILKIIFGRLWPETWVGNNPSWIGSHSYGFSPFHGGRGWASFPSGHTARSSALSAVLWHRVPSLRAIWIVLPLLIATALLVCDFHFLGDCVAGAWVGIASAALVMTVL